MPTGMFQQMGGGDFIYTLIIKGILSQQAEVNEQNDHKNNLLLAFSIPLTTTYLTLWK